MIINKISFGNTLTPVSQKKQNSAIAIPKNDFCSIFCKTKEQKIALGCLASFGIIGIAITTRGRSVINSAGKCIKSMVKNIKNKIVGNTKEKKPFDFDNEFKKEYLWDIDRIKHAFKQNKNGEYEKITEFFPYNGYMLTGPKSEAKENLFNWMLKELEKRGVEIIDPGNGKQATFDEVEAAWEKMWKIPTGCFPAEEEFKQIDSELKKTGKLKAFVVRGLDEIGQPKGFKEDYYKYPDGYILKDTPDTESSCKRHGVMLMYTCRDTNKVDPATIREGRIDIRYTPRPNNNEPPEIWKEYLECCKQQGATNKLNEAKEILSKQNKTLFEKIKPYFKDSVIENTRR